MEKARGIYLLLRQASTQSLMLLIEFPFTRQKQLQVWHKGEDESVNMQLLAAGKAEGTGTICITGAQDGRENQNCVCA